MPRNEAMERFQIRLPAETLQRLTWRSEEKGITLADCIRRVLADGTREQKPPSRVNERVVAATDEQWAAWRDAAAQLGMSLDDLLKNTMDGIVKKVFKPR